ncbi:hypothetical protein IFR23_06425 [Sphingomonas sp. CFBP 13603]|uniref:hypothetical protein n=1 Tax=Sphingomonas sp. CFBP 13603 TaxID=2774040 RepID=UPI0018688DF9|nr:hypothetical protein [Sphingomonas sp. CFBP 13603]MBE2991650.1 hypothetical protein [Sphingomonas sp. CFBP 13603]
MARSDKDNPAKEQALKFCVSSGVMTFLEVDVYNVVELTSAPKKITDIDVLGISLRQDGSIARTVYDCKCSGGPAFARALWLSGLMQYTGIDDGLILMGKSAERAHRLAARKLNVNVFGSNAFDNYAAATSVEYKLLKSHAGNIENWHRAYDGALNQPAIQSILAIIQQEVPLSNDPARSIRRLISRTLPFKGELNPNKPLHMFAFVEFVTSISLLLNMIVADIRNIVDLSEGEGDFLKVVRYYLWGGPEGVANLKRMYEILKTHDSTTEQETALIAWPQFVQLVRGLLESPTHVRNAVIALRELSLRQVADVDDGADMRLGRLFAAPRARQFAKRLGGYSASALRLPSEFADRMDVQIDQLVAKVG